MKNQTTLYWPKQYTNIALCFSFILIYLMIFIFPQYTLPFPILFFGLAVIAFFFIALNRYTLAWYNLGFDNYTKRLFWHSFFYRLIFVGIMYLLTLSYDPQSYPFEIFASGSDSTYYHKAAIAISKSIFKSDFKNILYKFFIEESDFGFPTYLGFIYSIFGPYTFPVRLFNCIWGSLTVVYIGRITRYIYTENNACIAGIIAMLMPSFLWFGGIHLKETLMIFLIITVVYHSTKIICEKRAFLLSIIIIILFSTLLFFFRTFLASLLILCVILYFFINVITHRINKAKLFISLFIIIVSSYSLISSLGFDKRIEQTINSSLGHFETELKYSAKQRGSISYKRKVVAPFLIIGSIVTPFPSLLDFEARQLGIYIHYQNEVVRNIMYFFVFIGIFYSFQRKLKESSLILMFGFGYIFVLAASGVSFQDRFQLPSLPFMIILMAAGLNYPLDKLKKIWVLYLLVILLAIFAWNYFKVSIRGLV